MLAVGNLLISEDIIEKEFVCNLNSCKGACCVAGDSGAPLEVEELDVLKSEFENYKPYLSENGLQMIEKNGFYLYDEDDQKYKTPLLDNGACVYINYNESGIAHCGIERAYIDKKTTFKKPVSCHLYPIRITKLKNGTEAVNYEKWEICKSACKLGKQLEVPVYKFVKDALVRKYGQETYDVIDAFANRDNPS
jgi:hypothetical protein